MLYGLGVPLTLPVVAADFVGFSCGAGVLTLFVIDYAPRRGRPYIDLRAMEPKLEVARTEPPRIRRRIPALIEIKLRDAATVNLMGRFGIQNDPATVSMI